MKIIRLELWSHSMKLTEPYTIAYRRYDTAVNVFLRMETDTGIIGSGCAAPDEAVTGEFAADVLQISKQIVEPRLLGADPLRSALIKEELKPYLKSFPSAMAMVDMALYDILGRHAQLPLYQLLGGFRTSIITSITIGIMAADETVARAREYVKQGFRALKIKGGRNVNGDIQRLLLVREAVGPDIEIRFDANQGYSEDEADLFIAEARKAAIEIFEQPTSRKKPEVMKKLSHEASMPIMADESLMGIKDAMHLARHGWADMINVKLMKVGGISEALKISAVAGAAGCDVMVGCMDESALGIAAGLHYALSRPNVSYADLDGHLGLEGDPAAGTVILRDGYLYPNQAPGLGFSFKR